MSIALDVAAEALEAIRREGAPAAAAAEAAAAAAPAPWASAPVAADPGPAERTAPALSPEKVVAETAMLLYCAAPLRWLDAGVDARIEAITGPLVAHARSNAVLAAICSDPGRAREHAVAHAILSRLGHLDPDVDRLLRQSLETASDVGPERLDHRRLEQAWLERVWTSGSPRPRPERGLMARSMLGRPVDALASTRLDLYAFTHAVMYASDLGTRRVELPRPVGAVCADAEAALAFGLDTDDFDLTAELCMTWPLLGRRWGPGASFAFGILARMEDERGFLPGIGFEPGRHDAMPDAERRRYRLATSYHATYVMGFLCAIAVANGVSPPAAVRPGRRSSGAGARLLDLLDASGSPRAWTGTARSLSPSSQDALAPLLLAAALRRARERGDIGRLRDALGIAVRDDLLRGPAPRQGVALLQRAMTLDSIAAR